MYIKLKITRLRACKYVYVFKIKKKHFGISLKANIYFKYTHILVKNKRNI